MLLFLGFALCFRGDPGGFAAAVTMAKTLEWRSATASDPGRMRAENQDRAYADDELGIFLVVDGLGGHAAGEKAAETAVEIICARDGQARTATRGIESGEPSQPRTIESSKRPRRTKTGAAWRAC